MSVICALNSTPHWHRNFSDEEYATSFLDLFVAFRRPFGARKLGRTNHLEENDRRTKSRSCGSGRRTSVCARQRTPPLQQRHSIRVNAKYDYGHAIDYSDLLSVVGLRIRVGTNKESISGRLVKVDENNITLTRSESSGFEVKVIERRIVRSIERLEN
jgi:hypothetical protein